MNVDKCDQYWSDEVNQSVTFDHMEVKTLEETVVVKKKLIERKLLIKSKLPKYETEFGLWQFFLTLFYMGGGVKKTPLADYRTYILGGCPKWADFS